MIKIDSLNMVCLGYPYRKETEEEPLQRMADEVIKKVREEYGRQGYLKFLKLVGDYERRKVVEFYEQNYEQLASDYIKRR